MTSVEIKGKKVLFDEEDFHHFVNKEWHICNTGYLRRSHIYFHRLVVGAKKCEVVDHINGNPLDNRKANLRICTQQQNIRNRNKLRSGKTSRFKGVSWDKTREKWMVRIGIGDGKLKNLGRFEDESEAARAYNAAVKQIDPDFYKENILD